MKKIIGLIFLFACLFINTETHAQSYVAKIGGLDTVTNAGTKSYTLVVQGRKTDVSFQVNCTKISGTVAGTVQVLGTLDGTNYAVVSSDTLVDASHVFSYSYTHNGYIKYKVTITGSGTQSSSYTVWALYR